MSNFIQDFIRYAYSTITNKTKVGLFAFNRRPRSNIFKDYGLHKHGNLQRDVKLYLRRRSRHFDIHRAVDEAIMNAFWKNLDLLQKLKFSFLSHVKMKSYIHTSYLTSTKYTPKTKFNLSTSICRKKREVQQPEGRQK